MTIRPRSRTISGKLYKDFVVDLGLVEGKRVKRFFGNRSDAEVFFDGQKNLRKRHGEVAMALAPDLALRYSAAEARLEAVGGSIEAAVDYFLARKRPVKLAISLGEALQRCLDEKEMQGLSDGYLATFASSCGNFVRSRSGKLVTAVERDEVKRWILGNGWSPRTQRGYLTDLRTFFSWMVQENYLSESPISPAAGKIQLAKEVRREPEIFGPEKIERLFAVAESGLELGKNRLSGKLEQMPIYRCLLGFLALATFEGVRPLELTRLPVSAIDWDGKTVSLDARVTKTNDRRVLELSESSLAWLRIWRTEFPKQKFLAPPSWDRLMKMLRKKSGCIPWPHDVLRHCFASYFHATHGDKAALQARMGHSKDQDTLEKHYRAVRTVDGRSLTKALAQKFWEVLPKA